MFLRKCAHHSTIFFIIILTSIFFVGRALSQELAVLKLILNTEDKGEFFLILAHDNDIWIKRNDLENIGFKKGLGRDIQFARETYVSLKSISELTFQINEEDVSLDITAPPHLFEKQSLDFSYKKPYKVILTKDRSAFLNYALIYNYKTLEPLFNISGELGISIGDYLGMSTFTYEKTRDKENAVRLITGITHNDRQKLISSVFGDFSASSGALGSGVVLGGINFSKNFSIDPYFLRFPSLNLSGTVETPSDAEVYLDGLLMRKERLSPGEFLFNDVPATVGFGTAKIVIKDAYGREKIISTPYYYTDNLLKKGLHEYSYSIGFIRKDFGVKNFAYGNPAFMSFHNYGFSEYLKLGYAAEASNGLVNLGPSASILISKAGILDAALAFSDSEGKYGVSGFLGYSFQTKNIGARIFLRSNSEEYSNLTMKPSDDKAEIQFSGAVGIGGKKSGFITADYSFSDMYRTVRISKTTISYNKALTKLATFFVIASETRAAETNDEIFLGLHIYLGKDVSGSVSYTHSDNSEIKKANIYKSLPIGTGFGYRAEIENPNGRNNLDAVLQYQNNLGIYEVDFTNRTRDNGYSFSVSGGIGYIDNSIFLSRPINDSFAKVKVDELEGVRVYYYNNEVDRTGKDGELIIPNMRSFHDNNISIESKDIPINYNIPLLTQYISPPYRSGAVVKFDVTKAQGITGTVYMLDKGIEVPLESTLMVIQAKDKLIEGLIGTDGEFYLENVPNGKYAAKIIYRGKECHFDIIIPDSTEVLVDLGKIICEAGK